MSKTDNAKVDFSGSDFSPAKSQPVKKITTGLICGEGGSGKTSFITRYCPDPLVLLNFDGRHEEAVAEARDSGRTIHDLYIPFLAKKGLEKSEVLSRANACIDKVMRNVEWAAEQSIKGYIRTVGIDTGTELSYAFDASYDGIIGNRKPVYGKDKDFVNNLWWRIFNIAKDANFNLIITSRAKEIYWKDPVTDKQEATGRFTYKAPSVMHDGVKWACHIRSKIGVKGRPKKDVEIEMIKAGINRSQLGEVYGEKDWADLGPFAYIAWLQHQRTTSPEDWLGAVQWKG